MEGLDYGASDRKSFGTPGVLVGMNRIPLRLRAVIAGIAVLSCSFAWIMMHAWRPALLGPTSWSRPSSLR
jgi:hypothetical protein